MDPPPKGRSLTVPILTSLPTSDRHGFLAGGRFDQAASSVRTGDHSALKDPAVPRGLLLRAGRPGVLLPVEVGPGFPWSSLMFLRGLCRDCGKVENRAQGAAFPQVSDLRHWSG
jgi:hypothetical protein